MTKSKLKTKKPISLSREVARSAGGSRPLLLSENELQSIGTSDPSQPKGCQPLDRGISKSYLFLNWKDIKHPLAGGAEVVTWAILKGLVKDGHSVTLLTARYADSLPTEIIDGITVHRVGGRLTHYLQAPFYYHRELQHKSFNYLIEQVNTLPYLSGLWNSGINNRQLFYHQLAREIWFLEMFAPLSLIGFLIEPIYTWLQSIITPRVITVSDSTRDDLTRFGFRGENIQIISEMIDTPPLEAYNAKIKNPEFTVLFHSGLRSMKRPQDAIEAFAKFYQAHKTGQLWISGGGDSSDLQELAVNLNIFDRVKFWGRTSEETKIELMQQATCLVSTSVKEGWGLIVSEAGTQATPSICYNVDGLRDACIYHGGLISEPNTEDLAAQLADMYNIYTHQSALYAQMCDYTLARARTLTPSGCYEGFKKAISLSREVATIVTGGSRPLLVSENELQTIGHSDPSQAKAASP